jgi:hypothetical protein
MATKPSQQPTHGSPAVDSLNWQARSLNWQVDSLTWQAGSLTWQVDSLCWQVDSLCWQVDSPGGRGWLCWQIDPPGRKLATVLKCRVARRRRRFVGRDGRHAREDNWSSRLVDSVVVGVGRRAGKVDSTDVEAG